VADRTDRNGTQKPVGVPTEASQEGTEPEVVPGKSLFGNRYSKAYKLRILSLADKCHQPGEIGRMLRQEGLTHCTLTAFRRQRAAGYLDPVAPRSEHTDQTRRVLQLEQENRKLKRQLEQAQALIDVQKKVSRLLEAFTPGDVRPPKESD
jgi:transposase-like protein